jgi:hypothetical protein
MSTAFNFHFTGYLMILEILGVEEGRVTRLLQRPYYFWQELGQ